MKDLTLLFHKDEFVPSQEKLNNISKTDWRREEDHSYGTSSHAVFIHRLKQLQVLVSYMPYVDGLHVSVSQPGKLPSWEDLKLVKNTFIGPDKMAFQVLPPRSEYVNLHPYCLHLWEKLEG